MGLFFSAWACLIMNPGLPDSQFTGRKMSPSIRKHTWYKCLPWAFFSFGGSWKSTSDHEHSWSENGRGGSVSMGRSYTFPKEYLACRWLDQPSKPVQKANTRAKSMAQRSPGLFCWDGQCLTEHLFSRWWVWPCRNRVPGVSTERVLCPLLLTVLVWSGWRSSLDGAEHLQDPCAALQLWWHFR